MREPERIWPALTRNRYGKSLQRSRSNSTICVPKGKSGAEVRTLFQIFLMLFEILMAVFMGKADAENQCQFKQTVIPNRKRPNGPIPCRAPKGRALRKIQSAREIPARLKPLSPPPLMSAQNCGQDLTKIPCMGTERRTRIDIVFEKVVKSMWTPR